MSDKRTPRVGQAIIFCNSVSRDFPALVTCVHAPECINLVFVSGDESKTDTYGRQIERQTSMMNGNATGATHGFYWRFEDEERNEYKPPLES